MRAQYLLFVVGSLMILLLSSTSIATQSVIYYPEFKGKNIIVTGGTAGIGFSTALEFAKQGANVAIFARDFRPDWYNGVTTVQMIRNATKNQVKVQFYKVDVSNISQVIEAIKRVEIDFGVIDICVNSAGIGGPMGYTLDQTPIEYLESEFDPIKNNLYGTLNMMHTVIGHWRRSKSSGSPKSIVNLSSYNGLRACSTCSMYSASKHGIIGLTQSAAIEYSEPSAELPRIRVNALCPGLIDTPLTRNQVKFMANHTQTWIGPLITDDSPLWLKYKPMFENEVVGKKLGLPEQMASIILFLSSNGASYMTGQTISADFGQVSQ